MRISVRFAERETSKVPINQNYFLAGAVYNALSARPDYARFLHDYGYEHEKSGRRFKLFVFSPLLCRKRRVDGEDLLLGPGRITWIISSPMSEFLTALAEGLLSQGEIEMRGAKLAIETVEALAEPEFKPEMNFTCLSAIVVARSGGPGEYAHFCTHEDSDFSERVRNNLIRKYELIHKRMPEDDRFEMRFDPDYIARKDGRVTKLINIRGIQIRGVLAPFSVRGSVELIRTGYEAGVGERGSMGFGCVEVDRATKQG